MIAVILTVGLLCGCAKEDSAINQAMEFRESLLTSSGCTFRAEVTADYEDYIYTFQMDCATDSSGNLQFSVVAPESIAGITGSISQDSSAFTFDDKVLAFPMLADGQLTPVSAPWIFIQTLRSGYLTGCSENEDTIYLYIDDSYDTYPLHLEIQTDMDMIPKYVEIIWKDRRILSMHVQNFNLQ